MHLVSRIQKNLTPDLLKKKYRNGPHPYWGHCYVASEAYYHLRGGKASGLIACRMSVNGGTHWFINDNGVIVDITAQQFKKPLDYSKAVNSGFLTKKPSKRTQTLIDRVLA